MNNDARSRDLATIHIAAKQLGMDRAAYEDMLWTVARVKSAGNLDAAGRARVLAHMKACGFKPKAGKPHLGRPHNIRSSDRRAQISKIEAFLAEARRPWSYADALAKRLCKVDSLTFCNAEQLGKIIAALAYDAQRHGRRT